MRLLSRAESRYELLAVLLVALYANALPIWQVVSHRAGSFALIALPIVAAGALFATVIVAQAKRSTRGLVWVGIAAAVLAAMALLLTDLRFPAKRIHVAEYMLLAFPVARAFDHQASGRSLFFVTALCTAVLGSHDELIQSLYPGRTYGLRDILVNALSGVAGAILACRWSFADVARTPHPHDKRVSWTDWAAISGLVAGWVLLLLSLPAFRGEPEPLWPLLPLVAGVLVWMLSTPDARGVLLKPAVLMLATAVYPLLSHALALDLH